MRMLGLFVHVLFSSIHSYAQYDNVVIVAYADFNLLMETLQFPTNQMRNEDIYNRLDEFQKI